MSDINLEKEVVPTTRARQEKKQQESQYRDHGIPCRNRCVAEKYQQHHRQPPLDASQSPPSVNGFGVDAFSHLLLDQQVTAAMPNIGGNVKMLTRMATTTPVLMNQSIGPSLLSFIHHKNRNTARTTKKSRERNVELGPAKNRRAVQKDVESDPNGPDCANAIAGKKTVANAKAV